MTQTIIGAIINRALGSTITLGDEANSTDLAAANLADFQLLRRAMVGGKTASRPYGGCEFHRALLDVDLGSAYDIGTVGLAGGNFSSSAQYRVRLSTTPITARTREAPTAVAAGNITPTTVANIDDDPESEGSDYNQTTSDTGAYQRVGFVATGMESGAGLQVSRVDVEAPPEGDVTVTIKLYDDTSSVETLRKLTVEAGKRVLIHALWDVDDAATPRIHVEIDGGKPTTGEAKLHSIDTLKLMTADVADVEGLWASIFPTTMLGGLDGNDITNTQLGRHFAWHYSTGATYQTVSGRYVIIEVYDDQNPDGQLWWGLATVGPSLYLPQSYQVYSTDVEYVDDIPRRTVSFTERLTEHDLKAQLQTFVLGQGIHHQCAMFDFGVDYPNAQKTPELLPFYAKLSGGLSAAPPQGFDTFNIPMKWVEEG